ncbi:MAG: hypothetical protein K6A65_03550 [Succinivibrionaceae bacterium]|nr:hypothetical protein [Succinivibrionaceae bacterium]
MKNPSSSFLFPLLVLALAGCSSGGSSAPMSSQQEVPDWGAQEAAPSSGALYLRGEMNDYAVSSQYLLRHIDGAEGLCADSPLRADWTPYRFKFADAAWSRGSNYGYADPPGVIRQGSADVRLNGNSRFEELTLHVDKDGIYRFCLIERGGSSYARVTRLGK